MSYNIIQILELIFLWLIVILYMITSNIEIFNNIKSYFLFKKGRNPYHRICKKCGSHQELYEGYNGTFKYTTWWEYIGKIHNENCMCKYYTENE